MFKKTFIFVVFVSVSLIFSSFLFPDEKINEKETESMFTEEVEVVGNVPVVKTIQSVSIFNSEEIETYNFQNLKSVLQLVPGLLTLSNGQFGQSSSTSIRGSKPSQVLYIVDGVKLRDGSGISGLSLAVISPFLVNRVEVVRGPLSNIYGSDAMGGVISINTTPKDGANFIGSIGSYNSYTGGFSGSTSFKDFTAGVSVNSQRLSNNIVNDLFKNSGLSAGLNYKNKTVDAGLRFFGNYTHAGIPVNDYGYTPSRSYKQNYSVLALPMVYRFNENSSMDVKIAYTNSKYTYNDITDILGAYFMTKFDNYEAEATYIGRLFKKLEFRAGFDYSNQEIFNTSFSGSSLGDRKTNYFSSFVSAALNLEALQVSASIRYDKYKNIDSNFSPQIGLSYLVANTLKLRASYSRSFLAPFVSQIINPWGRPNFDLKPEKGKSFELGAEFYSAPVTLSATYFNTTYSNLIEWITVDWENFEGQYRNLKKADTSGFELTATASPFRNLTVSGAYTYLHSKDPDTGKPLVRRPKHTFSGLVAYTNKRFTASVNMIYVGKRADYNFAIYPPDVLNPAFTTFDFNLVVPVFRSLDIFGKLTNVFDKKYEEFIRYQAPGRRFELGFKYKII